MELHEEENFLQVFSILGQLRGSKYFLYLELDNLVKIRINLLGHPAPFESIFSLLLDPFGSLMLSNILLEAPEAWQEHQIPETCKNVIHFLANLLCI